ncbi:hypothetical protein [Parabacteroides sp. PF5-9]|uniref:hypothetical protein n=1 Tax=Parabacteroides sp. PF5-9 TaxID=1742404 RepID=UPI00247477BD|nr:hypothetical protein [Parabacteroides sp. PF5-9]MDH6356352.1 hypothetical protein [Parabacteroides sp. PF5-9]
MTLSLSIIACVLSIASLSWNIILYIKQSHSAAISTNTKLIVGIEGRLGQIPELLRFHGIDNPEEILKQHGITSEEFAYLVNSFTVAGTFYRTTPTPNDILKEGSYRWVMCKSPSTQKAWPLVRIMLADSPYRKALDELIEKLKQTTD